MNPSYAIAYFFKAITWPLKTFPSFPDAYHAATANRFVRRYSRSTPPRASSIGTTFPTRKKSSRPRGSVRSKSLRSRRRAIGIPSRKRRRESVRSLWKSHSSPATSSNCVSKRKAFRFSRGNTFRSRSKTSKEISSARIRSSLAPIRSSSSP